MKEINLTKEEIIQRIGYFRTKKNMSAYKLGMELGHSKTYFYRVESGAIQLTIEKLLDILDILDVSTSEFFCPLISEEDLNLFEKINSLSSDSKETIINLISKLK